MSYIRPLSPYTFVEGYNDGDYVYRSDKEIEDYGEMSNETIIDILLCQAKRDKDLILNHSMIRLAENLKIKLRKKPLSNKEWFKEYDKIKQRNNS